MQVKLSGDAGTSESVDYFNSGAKRDGGIFFVDHHIDLTLFESDDYLFQDEHYLVHIYFTSWEEDPDRLKLLSCPLNFLLVYETSNERRFILLNPAPFVKKLILEQLIIFGKLNS
jgi:hypothetical protein